MHFSGRGFIHAELIDAETGAVRPLEDGAEGELVYTHLTRRAAPLLRFRCGRFTFLLTRRTAASSAGSRASSRSAQVQG
jgi:phenylacetate-coenzyme A ligase PaaK-like adenylate-forming protein